MLEWLKKRESKAPNRPADTEAPRRHGYSTSGQYFLLYKYLENRYANTVVLTFGEIEDLLGFSLPELARLRREWWTDGESTADRSSYSQSWLQASRTAKPNLLAQTVAFERAS